MELVFVGFDIKKNLLYFFFFKLYQKSFKLQFASNENAKKYVFTEKNSQSFSEGVNKAFFFNYYKTQIEKLASLSYTN